jgi:hypothetical protein
MKKVIIFSLCSLIFMTCQKGENDVSFHDVRDFYVYDVPSQTLSQITDDKTFYNYYGRFTQDGKGMVSVGKTSTGQFLYRYQGLTEASKIAIAVGEIIFDVPEFKVQQKVIADSSGGTIYYCADYYAGSDVSLYGYSRDIYSVAGYGGHFQNLTNNTTSLVGSIVLSDDERKLMYDELDTATSVCRIALLDLTSKTKVSIRNSDTTIFHMAQFLHNSDKIVCLEKKRIASTADIILISQIDSNFIEYIGATLYSAVNNFLQLSQNNLFPNINLSYDYEILDLETNNKIDIGMLVGNGELIISRSGEYAFFPLSGISKFDINAHTTTNEQLGNSYLSAVHLLDVNSDGNKILILGQRQIH